MTRARDLSASPSLVWEQLASFGRIADWAPNLAHSSLATEQTEGVGAARRVQVGRLALLETIDVWEPELTVGYRIEGLPSVVTSAHNTWVLRPTGDGGTSATLITEIETARTPLGRLARPVFKQQLARASAAMLDGLARAVAPRVSSNEEAP